MLGPLLWNLFFADAQSLISSRHFDLIVYTDAYLRNQSSEPEVKDPVMICGGLPTALTEKDAKEWLREKIANITHASPEIFCRADFKGFLWL